MEQLIYETLEQKLAVYKEICEWFDFEFHHATKSEIEEMRKNELVVDAQISLLRHLLSNKNN